MKSLIALFIVCLPTVASARHCNQFFHHKAVAVVAPVYPYAYSVGDSIRTDAIAVKAAKEAVRETIAAIQSGQLQLNAPAQQLAAPNSILAAKCARCHSGPSPKGGITLDGLAPVDCDTFRRSMDMLGGVNAHGPTPAAMQAVVAGLKPEDMGAIMQEMLRLGANSPPPAPVPGGLE